jgi:WD40 repeat protein
MKRARPQDGERQSSPTVMWTLPVSADGDDLVSAIDAMPCCGAVLVAIGFESGALAVASVGEHRSGWPVDWRAEKFHSGGTLCVTLTRTRANEVAVVTSGGDGCVRVLRIPSMDVARWQLSAKHSSARGPHGALIERVVASKETHRWAALVGRAIAVGPLTPDAPSALVYLGPLAHAADGLQLLPDGTVASASLGGVALWRPSDEAASEYQRAACRAAAPPDADVDLPCDGWARSLSVSPSGAWLASSVTAASGKASLWLWRVADGAEFECGGYESGIQTLCWSSDSRLLATSSGSQLLIWRFGAAAPPANDGRPRLPPSPAGRAPIRIAGDARVLTLAFHSSPGGHDAPLLLRSDDVGVVTAYRIHDGSSSASAEVACAWEPAQLLSGTGPPWRLGRRLVEHLRSVTSTLPTAQVHAPPSSSSQHMLVAAGPDWVAAFAEPRDQAAA